MIETIKSKLNRPIIFDFNHIPSFIQAMISWHKTTDPSFTITRELLSIRRCSSALVTRVIQGKRKLTPERVEPFARILKLNPEEKNYLKEWSMQNVGKNTSQPTPQALPSKPKLHFRKRDENHILKYWQNLYLREAAHLKGFCLEPKKIYHMLRGNMSIEQIRCSLDFLLQNGYLRRTLKGEIVQNELVVTSTDGIPNQKIERFHKKALDLAKRGIKIHPFEKRRASTVLLNLNKSHFEKINSLLKEFYESLLKFSEDHADDNEELYQVTIHLTPIGRSLK